MSEIELVFTLDKNFVQHCGVVLTSVFENRAKDDHFVIHLITNPDDKNFLTPLCQFISDSGFAAHVHLLDKRLTESFKISDHVSAATYYRLFIPSLLQNRSKVIYLDSDLIILSSLRELWETDLDSKVVAAVKNGDDDFFNAGVMIIDLERWRSLNVSQACVDWINENNKNIVYWDQDVLNAVLGKEVLFLPEKWNYLQTIHSLQQVLERGVRIIHFAGTHKPWNFYCNHPLKGEYFKYLRLSPWKNFKMYEDTWKFKLKSAMKNVIQRGNRK